MSSDKITQLGFKDSSDLPTSDDIKQPLTVTDVDWNIDVVLATNSLQQPAANGVPIVSLTLTLSDGSVIQRRLTTSELHKWRYTLARATKDLQVIQSRQPPTGKSKSKYSLAS